jgi:hypothetical protein
MKLGLRAAAKELGISHVALLQAARSGRVHREADKTFDVERCRLQLAKNSNLEKQRAGRSQQQGAKLDPPEDDLPSGQSYAEALRQQAWVKLKKDQTELEVKLGELAPIGQVNAFVAGMILRARDILLRIGPECRDRLAREKDPQGCEALVSNEVNRALRELAEYRPNAA